jgi:hypothetical protein
VLLPPEAAKQKKAFFQWRGVFSLDLPFIEGLIIPVKEFHPTKND